MNDLERRYHLLLLAFPRRYRERRGEEMVGTLMDSARPGQRWPHWADALDVLAAGSRARAGLSDSAAAGRVLAIAAPAGLSVVAGLSLVALVFGELGGRPDHQPRWDIYRFGPFTTPGVVIYLLVLAALAAFCAARVGLARLSAALAVAAGVACYAEAGSQRWGRPNLSLLICLGLCLAPLLLAAVGRPTRRARLLVLGGASALLVAGAFSFGQPPPNPWMSSGEAFYRSQAGLVSAWTPAVPVVVAMILLATGIGSVVNRQPELWVAGALAVFPAVAFVYGGRRYGGYVNDRWAMLALLLVSAFAVWLPSMALRLRRDGVSA